MLEYHIMHDPLLRDIFDPSDPGSSFPGDPALGDGLRWFFLGQIVLDEPDTLLVREPIRVGGGSPRESDLDSLAADALVTRVEGCAAGVWNVHVSRIWGDRFARTLTREVRFAHPERGEPDNSWPWCYDELECEEFADSFSPEELALARAAFPASPAGVRFVPGSFCEDGGTMVAGFERVATLRGAQPGWDNLLEFITAPDSGYGDFDPRLIPGIGAFSPVNGHGVAAKAFYNEAGEATEVRLGLSVEDDLDERLLQLEQERAALDARIAQLEAGGGYEISTGLCRVCNQPGELRLPVLSLLDYAHQGRRARRSLEEIFSFLSPEQRTQIFSGTHADICLAAWEGRRAGELSREEAATPDPPGPPGPPGPLGPPAPLLS